MGTADAERGALAGITVGMVMGLAVPGVMTIPVYASWEYRVGEPYAVRVTFTSPQDSSVWVFGRALLEVGLHAPTASPEGLGDVRIWLTGEQNRFAIRLCGTETVAVLTGSLAEAADFLAKTTALVPFGAEPQHMAAQMGALIEALSEA